MNLIVHGLIIALVISVTFANERVGSTESRTEQTLRRLRPAKVSSLFSQCNVCILLKKYLIKCASSLTPTASQVDVCVCMCLLCNACASVRVLVCVLCVLWVLVCLRVFVFHTVSVWLCVFCACSCFGRLFVWELLFSMLTDNLAVYPCVNFCLYEPIFWCRAKNNDYLICHSSPLVLHLAFLSVNCSAEQKVRNRASVADRRQDPKSQCCQGKYNLEMFA